MRKTGLILLLLAACHAHAAVPATPVENSVAENAVAENPAVEKLFVRAAPVALLATPAAGGVLVRQLAAGEALTVLGRQAGFVNVQTADGIQGWLREADVTTTAPPVQQLARLERESEELRRQLASAQDSLRRTQAELRQARAAAGDARDAGADRAAELQMQYDALQQTLTAREAEIVTLTRQVAQLEMAAESDRLLAASRPAGSDAAPARFSLRELAVGAAAALLLLLVGLGLGVRTARQRLRRRYHGLEL